MATTPQIQLLVEEVLESGRDLDDVCRDCPELIPQVRDALRKVQVLEAEFEAMFPTSGVDAPAAPTPLPGIPGYEIQSILGRGGMGVVYHARHLKLDRPVALKMLLSGSYAGPAEVERFRREAVAVARLHHPNIVQVHDVGEFEGRPFFTMELLEGGSLAAKLAGTPRPARESATLLTTLADAVGAAHGSGIVHRDLKPGNILLTADGTPKIADFGLARAIDSEPGLTLTGARVGTPSYMAPEQALGRRDAIGPAVDVYALGAVLYEVLTGRPPFRGETPAETERQVIAVTPAPPSRLNASVPRDLETICLKCLSKEPARRYASAAELADDLGRFLRDEPILARRIGRVSRAFRWSRRHPAGAALLVVVLLLLMLGTGLVVQDQVVAAERQTNSERARPLVEQVAGLLSSDRDVPRAKGMLDQISGPLAADLQERVRELQRELQLVTKLDGIRLGRIAVRDGRFDIRVNCRQVEANYDAAFREAGFAVGVDDPVVSGRRIKSMPARRQLVAALDDWSQCSGQSSRVLWMWTTARAADPDPSGWRERFRNGAVYGRPKELQQLADDVQPDAQPVQILVGLAEEMHRSGLDNRPLLRRVQQVYPDDFWVNYELGERLLQEEPQEAVRYLQAALAVRPMEPVVHVLLGQALAMSKRLAEARDYFQAAIRIAPGFASAHADLGHAFFELGEFDKAWPALAEAVRIDPSDASSHFLRGDCLLQRGDVQAAVEELRQAVHLAPADVHYHETLGKALEAANRPDEAKAEYETAQRLAQDRPRTLQVQDRRKAVAALPMAPSAEPRSAASIRGRADHLARLGEWADAAAEFRAALALEPDDDHARKRLCGLLTALGHPDEAIALYEQAVASHPGEPQAWDGYAELCLYVGRTDDYHRTCARVLEHFGAATDPRACELAARACLLLPPDAAVLQQAIELIDRAIAAEPGTRAQGPWHPFHLTKLLALYRAGRFAEVIDHESNRPYGDLMPAPLLVVAMAHHRIGKTDPAWRMLAMAGLSFDWRPMRALDPLDWQKHVLRREAEALVAPHLPELLAGRRQPTEDEDRAILLAASLALRDNARAAKLYAELLPSNSKMGQVTRQSSHRAACIAALAGAGDDASTLDESGRAQCRAWARRWLGIELDRATEDLSALPPERRRELANRLNSWTNDPELASLRQQAALERLPEAERKACERLWDRLEEVVKAAGGATDAVVFPSTPAGATTPTTERR
jgi:serine/threonine-protein kinase